MAIEMLGAATPAIYNTLFKVAYYGGTMAVILVIIGVIYVMKKKMVNYNVKVLIWQSRSDGWKKFKTKGAFIVDTRTKQEYFKVKGRRLPTKPPILNKLSKHNEAEFLETEVGELIPIVTTICREPILDQNGQPTYNEIEIEDPTTHEKKIEKRLQTQAIRVIDPDLTDTRMFQSMLMLESDITFSFKDWMEKYGNIIGTWSLLATLLVIVLIIWYTFSHPIYVNVPPPTNIVTGA